jgi:hypothetical protein
LNFAGAIRVSLAYASAVACPGCAPVISLAGAEFPVWILCLVLGILVSVSLRPLFLVLGIDEWMTPRPLIYSCLALVVAFLSWLLVWR